MSVLFTYHSIYEVDETSQVVQRLGLCTFTARGTSSILGWGTKIPYAAQCGQINKIKLKKFFQKISLAWLSQKENNPPPKKIIYEVDTCIMKYHESVFQLLFITNSVPLDGYTIFCLSICLLMLPFQNLFGTVLNHIKC